VKPFLVPGEANLAAFAAIHAASFAEPWSARALGELLASKGSFAFGDEKGFIIGRVASDEAEILTLAVKLDQRRRGVGVALVRAAAERALALGAGQIFLEVAIGNVAARSLYTGLGFAEVGQRKGYYAVQLDKREDALILRSKLPLPPLGKTPAAG
jgi:[ribosomal protein S18]-alanine N-acetyltransferase